MKKIKLAIVGSRDITDYVIFRRYALGAFYMLGFGIADVEEVISGGADGADEIGMDFSVRNIIDFTMHIPEWKTIGVKDAFDRNEVIARECDAAIVLWDGDSRGTQNTINRLHDYEKPHILVQVLVRKNAKGKVIEQMPLSIEFARPRGWKRLYEKTFEPDLPRALPVQRSSKRTTTAKGSSAAGKGKGRSRAQVRPESSRGNSRRRNTPASAYGRRKGRSKA